MTELIFFMQIIVKNILKIYRIHTTLAWSPEPPGEEKKFESFLAHILGMFKETFFTFEMWTHLSREHLHCKLNAIQIRHHRVSYA